MKYEPKRGDRVSVRIKGSTHFHEIIFLEVLAERKDGLRAISGIGDEKKNVVYDPVEEILPCTTDTTLAAA